MPAPRPLAQEREPKFDRSILAMLEEWRDAERARARAKRERDAATTSVARAGAIERHDVAARRVFDARNALERAMREEAEREV